MKNILMIFCLMGISYSAHSATCSISKDGRLLREINVNVVVTDVVVEDPLTADILIVSDSIRIEINRPATKAEIESAKRLEMRKITKSPVAYTQVNRGQSPNESAILMVEGYKIRCN